MIIQDNDTICAVSTPAGVGGIAVIRVSGPEAIELTQSLWKGANLLNVKSHTVHFGTVNDEAGEPLDQAVATVYRAPHSFTGENVVEISVHGSRYVQQRLIEALLAKGARLAEAGEFTRRSFASGKMDLAQAEAVADVIASESRAAHRIAINQMRGGFSERLRQLREQLITLASLLELELDFSEEDVEFASRIQLLEIAREVKAEVDRLANSFQAGTAIKNGIPVAIVGATNAGKSSLLNALLGDERAIVSDIHGTTRDIIEDTLTIGDYTFRLMDTAGLRQTDDTIESIGISRSLDAARRSQILIVVVDGACPTLPELPDVEASVIVAINKSDLPVDPMLTDLLSQSEIKDAANVEISATTGMGIDKLKEAIQRIATEAEGDRSSVLVTNVRHYQALRQASNAIGMAIDDIEKNLSGDLIAMNLRLTINSLGEIVGEITSSDLLATIFSRFCIGK